MIGANGDNRGYLLLARHARAGRPASRDALIAGPGLDDLAGVAERLGETLEALTNFAGRHDIRIGAVVHGTSDIATETAALVRRTLKAKGIAVGAMVGAQDLDDRHASPLSPYAEDEQRTAESLVLAHLVQGREAGGNAVLVVGG